MSLPTPSLPVVFVVEDNVDDADLFRVAARKLGFDIVFKFVSEAQDFIAYLQGQGQYEDRQRFPLPALVLLDLHLHTFDGFKILDWIRAQQQFNDLPVWIWSGSENPEHSARVRLAGADRFVLKPPDFAGWKDLVVRLAKVVLQPPKQDMPSPPESAGQPPKWVDGCS